LGIEALSLKKTNWDHYKITITSFLSKVYLRDSMLKFQNACKI